MNLTIDQIVLLLLVIVALAIIIADLVLWHRKRNARLKRRKSIPVTGFDEKAHNIPVRIVSSRLSDGTRADGEPLKESLAPHRLASAESEVFNLDFATHSLISRGDLEGARVAAEKALSVALKKLSVDHWLVARLLNRLAYCELCASENFAALSHLETAQAILSEWPGKAPKDEEVIDKNLAYCHNVLGI